MPIGKADVKREGTDVTIVTISLMVHRALDAAEKLAAEGSRRRSSTCARSCRWTGRRSSTRCKKTQPRPGRRRGLQELRRQRRGDRRGRRGGVRLPRRGAGAAGRTRRADPLQPAARAGRQSVGRPDRGGGPRPGQRLRDPRHADTGIRGPGRPGRPRGMPARYLAQTGRATPVAQGDPLVILQAEKISIEVPAPTVWRDGCRSWPNRATWSPLARCWPTWRCRRSRSSPLPRRRWAAR